MRSRRWSGRSRPALIEALGRLVFSHAQPAGHGLRGVPGVLDRDLSADAAGVRRRELAGAGRISAADPDQPYPALCRLLLRRRRRRRAQPEGWPARGKRRGGKTLAGLVGLCAGVLWRDPASGLRAPQLGGRFQFAAAGLANRLRPRLCAVQRRDGLRRAGDFPALCQGELELAGCAAAFGLRHLPGALHLHHLAAIRHL